MQITKFGHACVRFEHAGSVVVVDPGMFTEVAALEGAGAVLITHEHPDHYLVDHLRATTAPVFTIAGVADQITAQAPDLKARVHVVAPGDTFDAGLEVQAVGEWHAVIHPEFPRIANTGYLLRLGDVLAYHPGDALTAPPQPVDLLCLPVCAPWMRAAEAVEFAREVAAPRNLAIHDRVYSEAGLGIVDGHLRHFLTPAGLAYDRVADGADLPWAEET